MNSKVGQLALAVAMGVVIAAGVTFAVKYGYNYYLTKKAA
jgi:hypothetical protein